MTKRRFRSTQSGAIFVPNVDEATIEGKVRAGEWVELTDSPDASPAPRRRRGKSTN